MNLAFLISFMTFHFYLNLAFHPNVSTIRILIVIYFNFLVPALVPHIQLEHYQKEASQPIFLTLTFLGFISLGICHIFKIYDRQIFGE